jgi:hypothetical protein
MTDHTPLTDQQLADIDAVVRNAALIGADIDPATAAALLAEIVRLKQQRKYLITQLAKRDAESGRGDAALREFLAADDEATPSGSAPTPLTDARHPDDSREPLLWNDSAGNLLAIYPGCTDDEDRPTVALEVREPVFNGFFHVAQAEMPRLAADLCAAAGFRTVSERLLADAAAPAVSGAADSRQP